MLSFQKVSDLNKWDMWGQVSHMSPQVWIQILIFFFFFLFKTVQLEARGPKVARHIFLCSPPLILHLTVLKWMFISKSLNVWFADVHWSLSPVCCSTEKLTSELQSRENKCMMLYKRLQRWPECNALAHKLLLKKWEYRFVCVFVLSSWKWG